MSSSDLSALSELRCRGCRWQSAAAGSPLSGAHSRGRGAAPQPAGAGQPSPPPPGITAAAAPALPGAGPAAPARCLAVSFMLSPSPSLSPTEGKRERAWAAAGRLPVSQAAELKRRRAREKEAEQLSRGRGRLLSAASLAALPGGICRDGVGGRRERCCTTDLPAGGEAALSCRSSPVPPAHTRTQRRRGEGRRPPCLASTGPRVRTPGAVGAARTCLPGHRAGRARRVSVAGSTWGSASPRLSAGPGNFLRLRGAP